jgi:hypothetical protein
MSFNDENFKKEFTASTPHDLSNFFVGSTSKYALLHGESAKS